MEKASGSIAGHEEKMKSYLNLRNYFASVACLIVLGTFWGGSVFADCEVAKLLGSLGEPSGLLGWSASISGDVAILGDLNYGYGSAYVFRFNGTNWVEDAKFHNYEYPDRYGWSVGICGDTAVAGAPDDNDIGISSGSVYIYVYSFSYGWTHWECETKLFASDGAADDYFGSSVAISDDTIVVGADGDDDNGFDSGSAYIFRLNDSNWVEECKLVASDGTMGDGFGVSADISGDTIVIGATGDDDNGDESGSAYIFRFNGSSWIQEAKLLASDDAWGDYFGNSVGISGDVAIIGAPFDEDNGFASGSAYIFRFNGSSWVQEAKLLASDGAWGDCFGRSVSICGNTAVIGADRGYERDYESAYVFRFNGSSWVQETELFASDGVIGDSFGCSIGISGDTVVVGAPCDGYNGYYHGSAYIFDLSLISGDLDLDDDVDFDDLSLFAEHWLKDDCGPCRCDRADCTRDGEVNFSDYAELAANWLEGD